MMSLKNLKLKHQLAILIGIAILMMILIQFFYYSCFYRLTEEKAKVYAENITLPIFNTMPNADIKEKIGTCIILCKPLRLNEVVSNTSISKNSLFCIIDNKSNVVVSNKEGMEGNFFNTSSYMDSVWFDKSVFGPYASKKYIESNKSINIMGWKIVSIIPLYELTSELRALRAFGFFIGIVTTVLLLGIGYIFIKNITGPISQIVGMIEKIGDTNIKQRINMSVTNEIGVITKDINKMLDKIETMTSNIFNMQTRLYEMELSKKEAELSALQSQINPHFLYNTLECIRSIALASNITEIVNISTAMARIFRYSIKGDNFTNVRDEINCIQDYLSIMSIRYMGKFESYVEVDEELLNMTIIKMILQPIVENAVYHGLEQKVGKGKLTVKGSFKESSIVFEISDDGIGMSSKDLEKLNNHLNISDDRSFSTDNKRSIGLTNIVKRIKLYYGEMYGIKFFSRENEGTRVVVELPLAK